MFKLELPKNSRIYLVFYIVLLETALQQIPVQETLQAEGKQEYEVRKILDSRRTPKGKEYLVSWKGYLAKKNLWELRENLQKYQQALSSYY